jgi:hypothetical protein
LRKDGLPRLCRLDLEEHNGCLWIFLARMDGEATIYCAFDLFLLFIYFFLLFAQLGSGRCCKA